MYFNDGVRSIDFVLVWIDLEAKNKHNKKRGTDDTPSKQRERIRDARSKREIFETNLMKEGLELERETVGDHEFHFIKVYLLSYITIYFFSAF